MAARGKSSTGWFFGFKLHLVIKHRGEILGTKATPSNVDDRKPVPDLADGLFGTLYADKGNIAQSLTQYLKERGVEIITKVRKNMKPVPRSSFDLALLRQLA